MLTFPARLVLRFGVLLLFAVETTTTVMTSVGVYYQLLKVAPNTLEWFTIREYLAIVSPDNMPLLILIGLP